LALRGDEGRDKLRKSAGRDTYPSIRGCPNGATQPVEDGLPRAIGGQTRRTETSKYPEEKKAIAIPQVAASERGTAQTGAVEAVPGL
jgi:hypothetical protein